MTQFDTEIIEFDGCRVRIDYHYDWDAGPPWEHSFGHGPVRKSTYSHSLQRDRYGHDKRPGERPMNRAGHNEHQFYYDWAAAVELAREDKWNAAPFDTPNRVERAVQADFDFLSGWVNDQWHYAGAVCKVIDEDGEPVPGFEDSSWGLETWGDYHQASGRELADVLAQSYLDKVIRTEEGTWV